MTTVKVVAPADLLEGYTFDASANGKTFQVTVPAGGVSAGDEIEVPMPSDEEIAKASLAGTGALTGRFSTGLFDCFETFPCPCLMGFCGVGILTGQVLQRLKLNALGLPDSGDRKMYQNTCVIMTSIFLSAWLLAFILAIATGSGVIIWYVFYLYVLVAMTLARNYFRKKYDIPAKHFGETLLDDCCCSFWCGCCTILQMHRHTHDGNVYKYDITSKTGLPSNAPEIV